MVNPANRAPAAESRRSVSYHDCGECGRATLDGVARCQHCGYSAVANDPLATVMAAAFFVLGLIGLVTGDDSGAAVKGAVIGIAIIIVIKMSRRRGS